jgi:deoxyribodipyrimidine photo-lyase
MRPVIVWFRQDLRVADNPALITAAESGRPVLCLYIHDEETRWPPGGASRWWLQASLRELGRDLAARGTPLVLRRGPVRAMLDAVISETRANAVYWNRCYEPRVVARDTRIGHALEARGLEVRSSNATRLAEPWDAADRADDGKPYRVFTSFWRSMRSHFVGMPEAPPKAILAYTDDIASDRLDDWGLAPAWTGSLARHWTPGETGASARLERFLTHANSYAEARDRPDLDATSRLSPHLHWGEISPRRVWLAILKHAEDMGDNGEKFLSELGWREFASQLLFHNPSLPDAPLNAKFEKFPWADDEAGYRDWCGGRTGVPIVDAGMRQLWQTGWMHNRVRMVTASFLVKHLLVDWRRGEEWFWDTLVDADLANNSTGWQWVAGCGADAAPYFRIFNPVLQGEKFDPDGAYVRRFVPELSKLPPKYIHKPWAAPLAVLEKAGVTLGENYPRPIVDIAAGRRRALKAFESIKGR